MHILVSYWLTICQPPNTNTNIAVDMPKPWYLYRSWQSRRTDLLRTIDPRHWPTGSAIFHPALLFSWSLKIIRQTYPSAFAKLRGSFIAHNQSVNSPYRSHDKALPFVIDDLFLRSRSGTLIANTLNRLFADISVFSICHVPVATHFTDQLALFHVFFLLRGGRTINDSRLSTYPSYMTRVISPARLDHREEGSSSRFLIPRVFLAGHLQSKGEPIGTILSMVVLRRWQWVLGSNRTKNEQV